MPDQCQAITKGGKRCRTKPQPGSPWCVFHDPDRAAQRSVWSAKGGSGRSNTARARKGLPAVPLTNAELHAYLSQGFRLTMVGKMEPGVYSVLCTGGKVLADLSRTVDLEDQLAEMRQKIVVLSERRPA